MESQHSQAGIVWTDQHRFLTAWARHLVELSPEIACPAVVLHAKPWNFWKVWNLVLGAVILHLYVEHTFFLVLQKTAWDDFFIVTFSAYVMIPAGFIVAYATGNKLKMPDLFHSFVGGCMFLTAGCWLLSYVHSPVVAHLNDLEDFSGEKFHAMKASNEAAAALCILKSIAFFLDFGFLFYALCLGFYLRERLGWIVGYYDMRFYGTIAWDRVYVAVFGGYILVSIGYLVAYIFGSRAKFP
ncbi:unnamed protein product, partial [Cyprideis torosa]